MNELTSDLIGLYFVIGAVVALILWACLIVIRHGGQVTK